MKSECRVKAFYLLGFNKYLEEVGEAPGRQENELFLTVVIRRVLQKLTVLWTHFFHHYLKRTVTESQPPMLVVCTFLTEVQ